MVSLILSLEEGHVVEVGLVGNEGIVGVLAGLGTSRISGEAIVQMPGSGLRMNTAAKGDRRQSFEFDRCCFGTFRLCFVRSPKRRHAMRGISCPSDWRDGC